MATQNPRIEEHPDLLALRAESGGACTCIAPWVISGQPSTAGPEASNVITGVLVILMARATIAQGTMRGSARTLADTTLR